MGRSRHLRAWGGWFLDHERRFAELVQAETGKAAVRSAIVQILSDDPEIISAWTNSSTPSWADQ